MDRSGLRHLIVFLAGIHCLAATNEIVATPVALSTGPTACAVAVAGMTPVSERQEIGKVGAYTSYGSYQYTPVGEQNMLTLARYDDGMAQYFRLRAGPEGVRAEASFPTTHEERAFPVLYRHREPYDNLIRYHYPASYMRQYDYDATEHRFPAFHNSWSLNASEVHAAVFKQAGRGNVTFWVVTSRQEAGQTVSQLRQFRLRPRQKTTSTPSDAKTLDQTPFDLSSFRVSYSQYFEWFRKGIRFELEELFSLDLGGQVQDAGFFGGRSPRLSVLVREGEHDVRWLAYDIVGDTNPRMVFDHTIAAAAQTNALRLGVATRQIESGRSAVFSYLEDREADRVHYHDFDSGQLESLTDIDGQ